MYFVSPYIFCEGVPSLHSHTSGLSWSGPNYHSSNRPALPSPTLPAIEHPPSFRSTSCEIEEKVKNTSSQSPQPVDILGCMCKKGKDLIAYFSAALLRITFLFIVFQGCTFYHVYAIAWWLSTFFLPYNFYHPTLPSLLTRVRIYFCEL